jgi:tetratricopeptide (TPR) repeat protein
MNTPTSNDDLVKQARDARSRDWPAAAKLTAELRERFPNSQVGYEVGAAAARALRQFDEASAILTEAVQRFADQPWVASQQAWTAHVRAVTWTKLDGGSRFARPISTRARRISNRCGRRTRPATIRRGGAILTEAVQRFADQAWVAFQQAWTAHARGDLDEARRLAADLRNRFPQEQDGYQIGAAAARALRQFDKASTILTEAVQRFADQPWVASQQAWTAHIGGNVDEAIQLTAALRSRHHTEPNGYYIGASMLRNRNRLSEAEAVLKEAKPRFSSETWFIRQSAEVANLLANRADVASLIKTLGDERRDLPCSAQDGARELCRVVVVIGMHRAGTYFVPKWSTASGMLWAKAFRPKGLSQD